MKPRQMEVLLRIAAITMTITMTTSTPVPSRDAMASRVAETSDGNGVEPMTRDEKVVSTCLQIAPNLPPCNFDAEATWRSRSGEIFHGDPAVSGYPLGELPDFLVDGSGENNLTVEPDARKDPTLQISSTGENHLKEYHFYDDDIAITVVYYLEGCLPARLPFDLPSCPIDELQTIQMNKLVPFQLPGVQDAMIFPEVDVEQIEFYHRQSPKSHEQDVDEESEKLGRAWKDRPSNFQTKNENGLSKMSNGVQDFHKTMVKSRMTPRTGTASIKYVTKLPGSQSTSMASGSPSGSVKIDENPLLRFGKTLPKPEVVGIIHGDILQVEDRARVQ